MARQQINIEAPVQAMLETAKAQRNAAHDDILKLSAQMALSSEAFAKSEMLLKERIADLEKELAAAKKSKKRKVKAK